MSPESATSNGWLEAEALGDKILLGLLLEKEVALDTGGGSHHFGVTPDLNHRIEARRTLVEDCRGAAAGNLELQRLMIADRTLQAEVEADPSNPAIRAAWDEARAELRDYQAGY